MMFHDRLPLHFFSSAAEMYRAFTEIGRVWLVVCMCYLSAYSFRAHSWVQCSLLRVAFCSETSDCILQAIGQAAGRVDVGSHGACLLSIAPLLFHDLHASLNRQLPAPPQPDIAPSDHPIRPHRPSKEPHANQPDTILISCHPARLHPLLKKVGQHDCIAG